MGTATSAWTYKEGNFFWNYTIPANTSAEVRIPTDLADSITGADGMKKVRSEGESVICEVGAGRYHI